MLEKRILVELEGAAITATIDAAATERSIGMFVGRLGRLGEHTCKYMFVVVFCTRLCLETALMRKHLRVIPRVSHTC